MSMLLLLLLLERLPDGEGEQVAPDGAALRADGGQPAAQVPEVQMLQYEEDDGEADPAAQQHEGGHELGEGERLAGGPLTLARLARALYQGLSRMRRTKFCQVFHIYFCSIKIAKTFALTNPFFAKKVSTVF